MENKDIVKRLNKFLKGTHMGADAFKDYLEIAEDEKLRIVLVDIIESFKKHEEAITHRIEQLGGDPADTVGIQALWGEMMEALQVMVTDNDEEVLKRTIKALEMGIKNGNEFLEQNEELPDNIKEEIDNIVKEYYKKLNKLEELNNKN